MSLPMGVSNTGAPLGLPGPSGDDLDESLLSLFSCEGILIVPWSSRRARPEGVCRSWGRGLLTRAEGLDAGGWRGIDGILESLSFGKVS